MPFTGTQITRYIKKNKLHGEGIYESGVLKSSTLFDADGILIWEVTGPESDIKPGTLKEWYPNGQIEFELTFHTGMKYHGLMTLFDEKGEILEQELYEDGEMVEKIK